MLNPSARTLGALPHTFSWFTLLTFHSSSSVLLSGVLGALFLLAADLAGLDPRVGLFASVIMAISIAFTGGRPAMVSAAAGAVALVIAPLS